MTRPTLSDRNIAIIRLIARGHSNAEIGDALNVSVDTIKTHLRRIFERTHARNRAHLVAIAYDEGILEPGPEAPERRMNTPAPTEGLDLTAAVEAGARELLIAQGVKPETHVAFDAYLAQECQPGARSYRIAHAVMAHGLRAAAERLVTPIWRIAEAVGPDAGPEATLREVEARLRALADEIGGER